MNVVPLGAHLLLADGRTNIVIFRNYANAFNLRKVPYKFSNTLTDEKVKLNCVFRMCIKWK